MANGTSQHILVVGGGPAGASAAYWLAKAGFTVTVAERSTSKFAYGQGIDVTGPAVQILRRMGLYDQVKSKGTGEKGFAIVDDGGKVIARLSASEDESGKGFTLTQELEIMRGDMTQILANAAQAQDNVTYRYGCSITEISQSADHVTAVLSDTQESEDFAAIIGADGMMSKTRSLALDRDATKDCFRSIEQYTAFFSLPGKPEDLPDALLQHGQRRRSLLVRPIRPDSSERSSCYMVYTKESSELSDALTTRAPMEQQKKIFARIFEDYPGSLRDRVLKGMWEANDFYVSQTAQIKLPIWSKGRVVLSGDAAYAPSPATGQGTALAIIGSYIIAGELAKTPNDPEAAFAEYDKKFRSYVADVQNIPGGNALPKVANPDTAWGVRILRFSFWFIAWTGLYKYINPKGGNSKFTLPDYDFK
jgi:2-polyprenyl-6-methoxyphenol hydroxylase-like FAD-dependent oxidoreductase